MFPATWGGDAPMHVQDLPDGARGTGQAQPLSQQILVTMEVIQNRFWTRRALEVLWRMVADRKDALDHGRMQGR